MGNLVLVVRLSVDKPYVDTLRAVILENAANAINEEDCFQFDVSVLEGSNTEFLFYEVYKNHDALKRHRETIHFQKYWKMLEELGNSVERVVQIFDKIN